MTCYAYASDRHLLFEDVAYYFVHGLNNAILCLCCFQRRTKLEEKDWSGSRLRLSNLNQFDNITCIDDAVSLASQAGWRHACCNVLQMQAAITYPWLLHWPLSYKSQRRMLSQTLSNRSDFQCDKAFLYRVFLHSVGLVLLTHCGILVCLIEGSATSGMYPLENWFHKWWWGNMGQHLTVESRCAGCSRTSDSDCSLMLGWSS